LAFEFLDGNMENELLKLLLPSVVGLLGALLGSVASYVAIKGKMRIELMSHFRRELRSERMVAYREIWKALEPLALYAPPEDLTLAKLKEMERNLSKQYFEHGIFLSTESRDRYFLLQDAMQVIIGARSKSSDWLPLRTRDDRFTLAEAQARERALGLEPVAEVGPRLLAHRRRAKKNEEMLRQIVSKWNSSDEGHADFHLLRALGSRLRTCLAHDLEARGDIWAGFGDEPR
jgi:hypothetical protein